MTDLPPELADGVATVPSRLGVSASLDDGAFVIEVTVRPEVLVHGVVRASVLAYAVDVLAGVPLDVGSPDWSFTTDLSIRSVPMPAPDHITATRTVLRTGGRSSTTYADLRSDDGTLVATGVAGFAVVPRKDTDPPKPEITLEWIADHLRDHHELEAPLRDEAGIRIVDAAGGIVEIDLVPRVQNPAGTLQGGMVALVAEAAAEDLVATQCGAPVVVTDLDLRYLARSGAGPIRTRTRLLVPGPEATVQVELVDTSTDTVTTFAYARTTAAATTTIP